MRAAVLMGMMFAAVSAASAKPFPIVQTAGQALAMPSQDVMTGRYAFERVKTNSALLEDGARNVHYTPSDRAFGLGPFRADGAETAGIGHRGGLKPRYRLEGVNLFGGSVGGTVDGRGAMLNLHWGGGN